MRSSDWLPQFTEHLGSSIGTAGDTDTYVIDGWRPACVAYPENTDGIATTLSLVDRFELTAIAAGHGSQLNVGRTPTAYDIAISSRRMNHIIAHEADDLTLTVEAGMTLAQLNQQLARAGQHLPLDPPHPESATIGAIVATDACGPMRYSQGKARDLLIGLKVVLADGTVAKAGGQVVKNVAGYDLMKLFTGSHGTLGMIAEVSFKLRPLPERRALIGIAANDLPAAIDLCLRIRDLAIEPFSLQAIDSMAVIGLAGTDGEIESQLDQLRKLDPGLIELDEVEDSQRDLICPVGPDDWVVRIGAPASAIGDVMRNALEAARECEVQRTTAAYPAAGSAWIRFGGEASERFAKQLRALGEARKGSVVFPTLPAHFKERIDPWGALPAAALQHAIKAALDPRSRFGRYF